MTESDRLQRAIDALQAQRDLLGDAVVSTALAPLLAQLAALQAPAVPVQTLKLVSVLFLDIVGSTSLSQHLDPEEISAVVDGMLRRCSDVVTAHGGKVLQYAGDNLLAAFGAEATREDDAERAVHAGLALLAEGRALAALIGQEHGLDGLDVRVGLHTGSVLLGGGVDQEGTIRGVTVNLAARMEQTAPPGALRISHDTYHQVRGVFDVVAQPPLQVKGFERPVDSYLVQRAKPRAFRLTARGIDGVETPLIGRQAELRQLRAALDQVIATGQPQAFSVIAQAGLGKSRLLYELLHQVEIHPQSCRLLLARSHPSSALQPYGLLRDLLTWRLEIADSDSAEVARRKLVESLLPLLQRDVDGVAAAELDAQCLGQLIGFEFPSTPTFAPLLASPKQLMTRALAALLRFLSGLSADDRTPLVMLLEDLHWADEASLDWLQALLADLPALPLLLVLSARPALLERRADWPVTHGAHRTLTLGALADAERSALTASLLQRLPEPPPELLALIDHNAEGNPFYAEELVKMLLDQGVINVADPLPGEPAAWQLAPGPLPLDRIPATLTGVLQARLDRLSPDQRQVLQMASVIGPVFWDDALLTLAPVSAQAIEPLQRRSMVRLHPPSSFEGTAERAFHHHLLHQVTYDTVLKPARREGHARAAAWLQSRAGDRSDELLAITAQHFERAGDHPQAIEWYRRAARYAHNRNANSTAMDYCDLALALPSPADPRPRIQVLLHKARLCDSAAHYTMMAQTLAQAFDEASAIGAEDLKLSAMGGQVMHADRVGNTERAEALALQVAEATERADDAVEACLAWGNLAWVSKERGDLTTAWQQLERAQHWARQVSERRPDDPQRRLYEAQLLQVAAAIYSDARDDDRSHEALRQSLAIATGLTMPMTRACASCEHGLVELALLRADVTAARAHLDAAAKYCQDGQLAFLAIECIRVRACLALLEGDAQQAAELARAASADFAQMQKLTKQASSQLTLARASTALDARPEALAACRLALQVSEAAGDVRGARDARMLLARCLLDAIETGDASDAGDAHEAAEALALVRAELPHIGAVDAFWYGPHALAARLAAWQVLDGAGDAAAPAQLELAWAQLQRQARRSADPAVQAHVLQADPVHREIVAAWQAMQAKLDAQVT